ncbi:MAG TPA: chemotaxis protein CheB [Thermomicrobiaceae bacterium]|nr:chemotaxis protein CheB [Thermomicrobiaceae bacterium]
MTRAGAGAAEGRHDRPVRVVALAASAGGLASLTAVLTRLPADFPAAVVVLQHLPAHHPSQLTRVLVRISTLPVQEAADGDRLLPGRVYVAPPGRHLAVEPGGVLGLRDTAPVHFVRPSADVLFTSLTRVLGACAIAVVLSGRGEDGAQGAAAVHAAGGTVIAEAAATAGAFDMPAAAIASGGVDLVLRADEIADALVRLVAMGVGDEHA